MRKILWISGICILLLLSFYYWNARSRHVGTSSFIAVLKNKSNEVQTRRVKSLSWDQVSNGEHFQYYDSILTMANSQATVTFQNNTDLEIGADSMVVLEPPVDKQSALSIDVKKGTATLHVRRGQRLEAKNKMLWVKEDADIHFSSDPETSEDTILIEEKNKGSGHVVITDLPVPHPKLASPQGSPGFDDSKVLPPPQIKSKYQLFKIETSDLFDPPKFLFLKIVSLLESAAEAQENRPNLLEWDYVYGASGYEVQVAQDSDFSAIVIDKTTKLNSMKLETPQAGTYYWRVRGLSLNGRPGKFSQVASYDLIVLPKKIVLATGDVTDDATQTPAQASPAAAVPVFSEPAKVAETAAPKPGPTAVRRRTNPTKPPPNIVVKATPAPTPEPEDLETAVPEKDTSVVVTFVVNEEPPPSDDDSQNTIHFAFETKLFETYGTVQDAAGSIPSRSMLTTTLDLSPGLGWGHFTVSVNGDYFIKGQITSLANANNENMAAQGYLVGGEIKWQKNRFSIAGSYLFFGQNQLNQQTTLSQPSTYTQPTGYALTVAYAVSSKLRVLATFRDISWAHWSLGGDISTNKIADLSYGAGLSYVFR